MSTTQSKYGRRFDGEFKREVAALAGRPGAKQEQVARDLGVSPYSVSRWKKLYGATPAAASFPGPWRQRPGAGAAHQGTRARERGPARAEGDPEKKAAAIVSELPRAGMA